MSTVAKIAAAVLALVALGLGYAAFMLATRPAPPPPAGGAARQRGAADLSGGGGRQAHRRGRPPGRRPVEDRALAGAAGQWIRRIRGVAGANGAPGHPRGRARDRADAGARPGPPPRARRARRHHRGGRTERRPEPHPARRPGRCVRGHGPRHRGAWHADPPAAIAHQGAGLWPAFGRRAAAGRGKAVCRATRPAARGAAATPCWRCRSNA